MIHTYMYTMYRQATQVFEEFAKKLHRFETFGDVEGAVLPQLPQQAHTPASLQLNPAPSSSGES